jgi:hypothetical protein
MTREVDGLSLARFRGGSDGDGTEFFVVLI